MNGDTTTLTPEQFGGDLRRPDNTDAINAAVAEAVRVGGEVVIPPGTWHANITIEDCAGFTLRGTSRNACIIKSPNDRPALQANGMWYSRIQDLQFVTGKAQQNAVVEIDGNFDGRIRRGVQGNTFNNLLIAGNGLDDGKLSRFAFAMCRQGTNSAQGSENLFLNCHFAGARQACYYQQGFNALNNQFIGGNVSWYDQNGMQFVAGSFHIFGMGFQCTRGYTQIDNDGWDIAAYSAGAIDPISVIGCRTESFRFYKGAWSQPPMLQNCCQRFGVQVDPARPVFNAVELDSGIVENCFFQAPVKIKTGRERVVEIKDDYNCHEHDDTLLVGKDATVKLVPATSVTPGKRVTICCNHGSECKVITAGGLFNNIPGNNTIKIGSGESAMFAALGGGNVARRWFKV